MGSQTTNLIKLENTTIDRNKSDLMGGGITALQTGVDMTGSTISNNNASGGAGVFIMSLYSGQPSLNMRSSRIISNSPQDSAYPEDLNYQNRALAGRMGGGIFVNGAVVINVGIDENDSSPSEISRNSADNGGGVAILYGTGVTLNINNGEISYNSAESGNGGGIYENGAGTPAINLKPGGEISKNYASNGGGVYINYARLMMQGGKLRYNTAINYGGGIYADQYSIFYFNSGYIGANRTFFPISQNHSGTDIYKHSSGQPQLYLAPDSSGGNWQLNGEMRLFYPIYYLLSPIPDTQTTPIYISIPETATGEASTTQTIMTAETTYIDTGGEYPVVSGYGGYKITEDDFEKFAYLGEKDYELKLNTDQNIIYVVRAPFPTRTFTVTHTWDDEDDRDDIRPENTAVKAQLMVSNGNQITPAVYNNGEEVEPVELTIDEPTAAWSGIPKYDAYSNVIQYGVKMLYEENEDEEYVPEGYVRSVHEGGTGFMLSSVHTPETINITAYKVWRDDLKSYEPREQIPFDINITLTGDGKAIEADNIDYESSSRRWIYTWKNLPLNSDEGAVDYQLDENNVPDGYSKTITSETDSEDGIIFTVTNTQDEWDRTPINDIEVNVPYPAEGGAYSAAAPTVEGTDYKIKSFKWLRRGSTVNMNDKVSDTDAEYTLVAEIVPNDADRYAFADNVKTTVNVGAGSPATKSASVSTDYESVTLEWTFRGASFVSPFSLFDDLEAIRNTSITINPPSQDRLPAYSAPTADGEGYEIASAAWYDDTKVEVTERFELDKPYNVAASVKANAGYGFDFGTTNVTVNGSVRTNKAELQANAASNNINWYFDALTSQGHNVTTEGTNGTVTADKTTNVAAGEEVTITLTPDAGYTADGVTPVVTRAGEDDEITVTNNKFTMPGSDANVKAVFKKIPAIAPVVTVANVTVVHGYTTGNTLTASVTNEDTTNYNYEYQWYSSLDNEAADGAKISGATEKTYTVPVGKDVGDYYYYCTVTAARKDNGETASASGIGKFTVTPGVISDVQATIIEPVAGQTVGDNIGAILPIGVKYVQSKTLIWKKGNDTVAATDKFEYNTTYKVELTVEAISGNYKFADEIEGQINGDNVTVTKNPDGTATVSYEFTTPEEPAPGVPYAVIANPEIVTYGYTDAKLTATVNNCDFAAYTYTYQWYDEDASLLEGKSGNVTANEQKLVIDLPTGKDVGAEKYYVVISGAPLNTANEAVKASSNNGAFVVQPKEITTVTITGVDDPEYGKTPDTEGVIADSENYTQSGAIGWYDGDNAVSAFDYDTNYTAKIALTPKANYVFAETVTATVNGKAAAVAVRENGNEAVVTYDGFDNTETAPAATAEPTIEPTTEPTAEPSVTTEPTTAPTIEPIPTATTAPTIEPEPTATPEPTVTPTATPRRSSGGGGGGVNIVKTAATPTPSAAPSELSDPTETNAPNSGTGNGGNSGNGGHMPELNKEDHFAYMAGYPEGIFKPDASITRAEATVMFSRLLTETMEAGQEYATTFTDISPETDWFASQIGFMEQFGIVEGYEDGTFRPDNAITRAEFSVIASKFDRLTDTEDNVFSDVADDFWAKPYILLAHRNGWVEGYEDETFRPFNSITRAEVVSIVNRMLERKCDEEYVRENIDSIITYSDINDSHWAYFDVLEASNGHLYEKNPDEVWLEIKD